MTEPKTTEQRLRDCSERLHIMTSQVALAEERERRRIATLLHDDVGHGLALAQIRLGKVEEDGSGDLRDALAPVRELIANAIETTRSLTFELSSPVLYELGLEAALRSAMDRLAEATGMHFDFESDRAPRGRLTEDTRVLLYRAVRELLLNAAKHSRASCVTVTVRTMGDEAQILVTDDGVGFDVAPVLVPSGAGAGHGLLAAMEHVESVGGRLEVTSTAGTGTRGLIIAPLGSRAAG